MAVDRCYMQAIVVEKPTKDVTGLELRNQIYIPVPESHQVLLKVGACGVCYRDLLDRQGAYPFTKWPIIPGHEFAGEVVAVGPDVTRWKVGSRVVNLHSAPCFQCKQCASGNEPLCTTHIHSYGMANDGGYAEYVTAHENSLVALPNEIPFSQACFLHCTAGVALRALRTHARLQPGERVLITGATGGVGVHAIQVAKILGAHVVALTSSNEKSTKLKSLGADEVIVVSDPRAVAELSKTIEPVQVVLELTGSPTFAGGLRCLSPGGRTAIVGNVNPGKVEVNPGLLIMREYSICGSAGATKNDLEDVLQWVCSGKLRPIVSSVLPLERAREAQQMLASKAAMGRIVLQPPSAASITACPAKL